MRIAENKNHINFYQQVDGSFRKRGLRDKDTSDEALKHLTEATLLTYNYVIYNCLKKENDQLALQAFEVMKTSGIKPNLVTFSIFINNFLKRHEIDKAIFITEEMGKLGLKANEIIHMHLIDACVEDRLFDLAAKVFKKAAETTRLGKSLPKIDEIYDGPKVNLHGLSFGAAYLVVRKLILGMEIKESKRFVIITGRGNHSKHSESTGMKSYIKHMIKALHPEFKVEPSERNPGLIFIQKRAIKQEA